MSACKPLTKKSFEKKRFDAPVVNDACVSMFLKEKRFGNALWEAG
jgi:hypothetical protein